MNRLPAEHVHWSTRQIDLDFLNAAEGSDLAEAKRLITEGADINAAGEKVGGTALIMAFRQSDSPETGIEWATWLLEHGANPNIVDPEGEHALYWAVHDGVRGIKLMLRHGADPNLSEDGNSSEALDHAYMDSVGLSFEFTQEMEKVIEILETAGAILP